jgi:DNA invertase Pin-like site-specific DNA recombinase
MATIPRSAIFLCGMAKAKRAAIYIRVSTDDPTVENQRRELTAAATARGWTVVAEYADEGISGAKGRDGRPQLDLLLKDAVRRCFDVAMVWAVDRLGRSLPGPDRLDAPELAST